MKYKIGDKVFYNHGGMKGPDKGIGVIDRVNSGSLYPYYINGLSYSDGEKSECTVKDYIIEKIEE